MSEYNCLSCDTVFTTGNMSPVCIACYESLRTKLKASEADNESLESQLELCRDANCFHADERLKKAEAKLYEETTKLMVEYNKIEAEVERLREIEYLSGFERAEAMAIKHKDMPIEWVLGKLHFESSRLRGIQNDK